MTPITSKFAYIEFFKEGNYVAFACATSLTVNFTTTEISTATVGDGIWEDSETQSVGYNISLGGLIPFDEPGMMNSFDLLQYLIQMVGIQFRIVFNKADSTLYTMIKGVAGVRSWGITADTGFAQGTVQMIGKGEPIITDVLDICNASITSANFVMNGSDLAVKILTVSTGTVPRYDYRVDGGPTETSLDTGWTLHGIGTGHILEIWPVCENGIYGVKYTHSF